MNTDMGKELDDAGAVFTLEVRDEAAVDQSKKQVIYDANTENVLPEPK